MWRRYIFCLFIMQRICLDIFSGYIIIYMLFV